MSTVKVTTLSDLKLVKKSLAAQAKALALEAQEAAKAKKQVSSDRDLFVKAAGTVKPLPDKRLVEHPKVREVPTTMQYQRDDQLCCW